MAENSFGTADTVWGGEENCADATGGAESSFGTADTVGGGEEHLTIKDCSSFIKTVQQRFTSNPETYKKFMKILKDAKENKEKNMLHKMIEKLDKAILLFADYKDLLRGHPQRECRPDGKD